MPKVLVIGHLTLDAACDQTTETATFNLPQGAALGSAVAAATAGASVDLIAIVGHDYPPHVLEQLERAGVHTGSIERRPVSTLRFWLLRESHDFAIDHPYRDTPIPAYTPLTEHLPDSALTNVDAAHICPMPIEDQLIWVNHLRGSVDLISVDPQPFRFASPEVNAELAFRQLLRNIDILSISLEDFPRLLNGTDVSMALQELIHQGPQIVTLKMNAHGSAIGIAGEPHYLSVAAIRGGVRDPTGAGDAYAGSFVAKYAATRDVIASARRASATAHVTIKNIGVLHLLDDVEQIDSLERDNTQIETISTLKQT